MYTALVFCIAVFGSSASDSTYLAYCSPVANESQAQAMRLSVNACDAQRDPARCEVIEHNEGSTLVVSVEVTQ